MSYRKVLPYSPNMMFPGYTLGCHQEAECIVDSNRGVKIVGMSLVKNESLDNVKRNINKKYGIGG